MELNLKNKEIIYIYEHFNAYKDGLENRLEKEMAFAKGQMDLYKSLYGDTKEFDEKLYQLHEKMFSELMPEALKCKLNVLNNILNSFEPIYSMIAEADQELVQKTRNELLEPSQECKDVIEQIKEKLNDKNKF